MEFLSFFNAIDPIILSDCRPEYKKYYNALGIMIIILFLLSILGIYSILTQIGLNDIASALGGFFFSFFFLMFYRLNIISISSIASDYEERNLLPKNEFLFRDLIKFVPITIFSWFIASGLLTLIYQSKLEVLHHALKIKNAGWFTNYILLKQGLGTYELWVFIIAVFVIFCLPLFSFFYIKEIRNGQYNYLNNNYQNSLILSQYNYCKDAYEIILREKAGKYLRDDFDVERSFIENPYEEKEVEINGEYSVPLIMSDKIAIKEIQEITCRLCGNLGEESFEEKVCDACYQNSPDTDEEIQEISTKVYDYMKEKFGTVEEIIFKFKDIPIIENLPLKKYFSCKIEHFINNIYYIEDIVSIGVIQESLVKLYSYQIDETNKEFLGYALKNCVDFFNVTKQYDEELRLMNYTSISKNDEVKSFHRINREI